jgi:hypothetical protein
MRNEPFHESFIGIDISICCFSDICVTNWYFTLLLLLLVLSNFWPMFIKWFNDEANCRSVVLKPKITNHIHTYRDSSYRQSMAHNLFTDFKD